MAEPSEGTLTIEIESTLLKDLDRVATLEAKERMEVVKEAIVRYIDEIIEMADLKQLAAEKSSTNNSVLTNLQGLSNMIMP